MSTAMRVLSALGLTPNDTGEYRCNSPFRSDSDSNSFTLKISDDEHGAFTDHAGNRSGTLYELANHLSIATAIRVDTSKRAYQDHHDYATHKGVTWLVFEKAGWTTIKRNRRPAMAIDTDNGKRYRYLDYQASATYINDTGYKSCWYKLREAVIRARIGNLPLILCNGESSVVVAQHYELPATSIAGGGEKTINATLLDELCTVWTGKIIIAMDCDETGRTASKKLLAQLTQKGYAVSVVDLRLGEGGDLADYAKLYQTSAMAEIMALPTVTSASAEINYVVSHSIISARDLDKKRFDALRFIVEDFGPEGTILVAGKPKTRKSWLTLGISLMVAYGRKVLGRYNTVQGSVLYMDLESNQRRMQSRLRQMAVGDEELPDNLYIVNEWSRGESAVTDLDNWLTAQKDCVLVVIDILENIRAPRQKNGNPYEEDYNAVKPLTVLAEKHHCLILIVHHTRKAKSEDAFDEISGTTGLVGGVSGMWVLARSGTDEDSVQQSELIVRGRDIDSDDRRTLQWSDETSMHKVVGDDESFMLSPERKQILEILSDGYHKSVAMIVKQTGKSRQNTHKLLTRLKAAGMVKQDSNHNYFVVKNATVPVGYDDEISEPVAPLEVVKVFSGFAPEILQRLRVLAVSTNPDDTSKLHKTLNSMSIFTQSLRQQAIQILLQLPVDTGLHG